MKTISEFTSREIEIEQVRRRLAEADAEIHHILVGIIPGMLRKQAARRAELARQESKAAHENVAP